MSDEPPGAVSPETEALELLVALEHPRYELGDVSRLTGIDPELVRSYWRALGFAEPVPGVKAFSDTDVEMLSTVLSLIADGSLDPEVSLQMARVIGSALERVAVAQVEAVREQAEQARYEPIPIRDMPDSNALMPRVFEVVWRRHLVAAARRQLLRSGSERGEGNLCVGFADLVGFTAQTQQLEQHQLARVVGRFETIAFDVVHAHAARVVKTIGDEVMFVSDDVGAGCRLALDLASAFREDPDLSDVRVGLAYGPVLEREGDVFGHTVNLASRVVSIAYPGSVVVSSEVHDAVADDPAFVFTSLRSFHLRDIGRVPLWRMRRADDVTEDRYRAAQLDRSARLRVLDLRRERRYDALRARADELLSALGDRIAGLPGRLPAVLSGNASPEVVKALLDDPTETELAALAEAVLDADLDGDLRHELLTGLAAAVPLKEVQTASEEQARRIEQEAEQDMLAIERDTAERIDELRRRHGEELDEVIADAEARSRRVDLDAADRLTRLAEEAEASADRITAEAERRAARAERRRGPQ